MVNLSNPCTIEDILHYAWNVPFNPVNDNNYINAIYDELANISDTKINKGMISAIFQLTMHYAGDKYIDVGCAILSFATLAKDLHDKIWINIIDGNISVSKKLEDNRILELKRIQESCNSIKMIIAQIAQGA